MSTRARRGGRERLGSDAAAVTRTGRLTCTDHTPSAQDTVAIRRTRLRPQPRNSPGELACRRSPAYHAQAGATPKLLVAAAAPVALDLGVVALVCDPPAL